MLRVCALTSFDELDEAEEDDVRAEAVDDEVEETSPVEPGHENDSDTGVHRTLRRLRPHHLNPT